MGDFIQAIGQGFAGLVIGALQGIGTVLRGMVESANALLPGGVLALVAFVFLLLGAWALAKR